MAVWLQNIKRQTSPNITIPVPLYTDLVGAYIGVQDWVRTIEGVTGFTQIWAPFNESMTAVEEYVNKTG